MIKDTGTRMTYAQAKAHLRGIALAVQNLSSKMGEDFTGLVTSGYAANTVLRNADIAIDGTTTGLMGLTSASGIKYLSPPLDAIRKKLTGEYQAGTTQALIALGYGEYVKALMAAVGPGHDDTYASFWLAYNELWTEDEWVPGEVVDIMAALGIRTDPAYCHPPTNKWLGTVTFSGAETAAITAKSDIDPSKYKNHVCEVYVAARNVDPDEVELTITALAENASPIDEAEFEFTVTVPAGAGGGPGQVIDIAQAAGHQLCSLRNASLEITGGKDGDIFHIRVKAPFSMVDPT